MSSSASSQVATRRPSDPCELAARPPLVSLSLLAALPLLVTSLPASAADRPKAREFWLQASPESNPEKGIRDALANATGFAGPLAAIPALRQVTDKYPGTTASGLAELAAGLILVDADRPAEAIPYLTHADIQQTLLFDYALMGLGRAQEALHEADAATQSFLAAAGTAENRNALACEALSRAADNASKANAAARATAALERALAQCSGYEPRLLLQLAKVEESAGHNEAAAAAYDRLDREYPTSDEAHEAAPRLAALGSLVAPPPPAARAARDLAKGLALFEAHRYPESVSALKAYLARVPSGEEAGLARVRLARASLALGRRADASLALAGVGAESPYAAEADFTRARIKAAVGPADEAYSAVAATHPSSPWGEEALLALANNYQKDARDDEALPYWRRLLAEYPDGQYAERAAWRTSWADYRAGRFEDAAQALERTARLRPETWSTAGFLYWAGRSRAALAQNDRARQLFDETVLRFKYSYHGLRARDALAKMPHQTGAATGPTLASSDPAPADDIPEPQRTRVRQLLLTNRLDEAASELRALPASPKAQATIAWTLWKRGKLRPAITAMKRAYPEWISEAGDRLPAEVWRILFPIEFKDPLVAKASAEGLDPALVAALILQESTFDPGALSRAGARGLMQVIPATGRKLARDMRVPYRHAALHDPKTSLDFGTLYLRQMADRFDNRAERVLAAYNAGPHRVDAWTALRPEQSAEEFVESIPFSETRAYVMIILAGREQYRRLYGLNPAPAPVVEGRKP
jgi:peptidoglycan lytic transglycosylase